MAPFTTWKIGGPAEFLFRPKNVADLKTALQFAVDKNLQIWLLGRGSNVLISDHGLPGLTILMRDSLMELRHDEAADQILAGAGVPLPRLSRFAATLGWGGYEFLIGIPGTVGGGLFMNCGYKKGDSRDLSRLCESVDLYLPSDRELLKIPYSELMPGYRYSLLHDATPGNRWHNAVIVDAAFRCPRRSKPAEIRAVTAQELNMRRATQPLSRPTAGSVFVTEDGTPAAIFIDRAGLKGHQIGGAMVSRKHANWIENVGNATAADVIALLRHIQTVVDREFGISLKHEVRILGQVP